MRAELLGVVVHCLAARLVDVRAICELVDLLHLIVVALQPVADLVLPRPVRRLNKARRKVFALLIDRENLGAGGPVLEAARVVPGTHSFLLGPRHSPHDGGYVVGRRNGRALLLGLHEGRVDVGLLLRAGKGSRVHLLRRSLVEDARVLIVSYVSYPWEEQTGLLLLLLLLLNDAIIEVLVGEEVVLLRQGFRGRELRGIKAPAHATTRAYRLCEGHRLFV